MDISAAGNVDHWTTVAAGAFGVLTGAAWGAYKMYNQARKQWLETEYRARALERQARVADAKADAEIAEAEADAREDRARVPTLPEIQRALSSAPDAGTTKDMVKPSGTK